MKLSNMTSGAVAGFSFSAVRPETLKATEYTLVTLALDKSGSVLSFADALFEVKKRVVEACRKSPRADFLLLRVLEFNGRISEVHGFMPLQQVDVSSYATPKCEGMTALRDTAFSALGATNAYAKQLADSDYLTNALVVVATDGDDTASSMTMADLTKQVTVAVEGEHLESLKVIVIAVNAKNYEPQIRAFASALEPRKAAAATSVQGITEYVDVGDATPQKLAKLADFVSRSISATSQAIGTGGASQAVIF